MNNATPTQTTLPENSAVTHRLVGWGVWSQIGEYVLPRLFGHLVALATPVVKEYHGDLFRDAEWLRATVTGPIEMDYVVRHHGTHLGEVGAAWNMARSYMDSPAMHGKTDRFYRLSLTVDDRGEWSLTIQQVPR